MANVLVLYYSSYGHIETMASAVAAGAREAGANAVLKRVPELVPEDVAKKSGYKLDQVAPIATVDELPDYDAIIIGTPTRYGNMTAQMKNFLDQTGGLWFEDKLVGKIGSVFTSTGSQHGGQETTIHDPHGAVASRHGDCRSSVQLQGPDADGRNHRRLALRRVDDCQQRRPR